MNTANSQPTALALNNAKMIYTSAFTTEVFMNGFTPTNMRNHFAVSTVIVRGGIQAVIDWTFTKKTGKLVNSEVIEQSFI